MEILWVVIAFLAGLAAQAARLPTLVGFLAAGLVLSQFGVTSTDLIHQAGEAGVVLLLFTIGLHLNPGRLAQPVVLGVGGLHLLVSAVVYTVVAAAMSFRVTGALLIGVALGFSSTVLTAKSLESRRELDTYHGRVAIGILILQDIVATALLALSGASPLQPWILALITLPLARPALLWLLTAIHRDELTLLFGVSLAASLAALFHLGGLSVELGALVAGLLVAGHERSEALDARLWSLKELFLVGFFLEVGLAGLPGPAGLFVLILLLVLLPLKGMGFFLLLTRFHLRARTSFMAAVTLTAYSEFALIVGAAVVETGAIPQETLTVLALLVAVSFMLNAPLSRMANDLWARWGGILVGFERAGRHPDHQPQTPGRSDYLILGMGRVGTAAYDYLIEQHQHPLGLDADPRQVERHLKEGRRVAFGDAQDPELWGNLRLDTLAGVMLALPSVEAKVRAARALRRLGFRGTITALVREGEVARELVDAGVESVILPLTEAGRALAEAALHQRSEMKDA